MTEPRPMWHAFGDEDDRIVRPNGDGDIPDPEITNNISKVSITAYGDVPSKPFVEVHGFDKESVEDTFTRVITFISGIELAFGAPQ